MNIMKTAVVLASLFSLASCSSFKAERLDNKTSDEKALTITDQWVQADTEKVILEAMKEMGEHKGLKRYTMEHGKQLKMFVGEVQNLTAEAYFPINDINDELLNEISKQGDFVLVDAEARQALLKEITYQNDGMVDPKTAKKVGKQTGADLMIFGNVYMKPETRDGRTIKQYSVNLRITDIQSGLEIFRTRTKLSKYSEQKKMGW
ncbi:MAG: CsgG/HfaB family protein [Bacteriovorax sp.]|nr:CsgG/HfaB family protein [Bacteriovorax sp.]